MTGNCNAPDLLQSWAENLLEECGDELGAEMTSSRAEATSPNLHHGRTGIFPPEELSQCPKVRRWRAGLLSGGSGGKGSQALSQCRTWLRSRRFYCSLTEKEDAAEVA